jgi:tripartite-type tricarboxylate transporter receptor subunit TctC
MRSLPVVVFLLALCQTSSAHAQAAATFYQGKRLEIRVGSGPGGGYDLAARLVARYIGKYLPGQPNVIVQNVPGAASITLMNQLQSVAPQDGTVIGVVTNGIPTAPLLTPGAVRFDLPRFHWIGSPAPETQIVMVWSKARVQTLPELFAREMIVGAVGPGTATYDVPMVTNAVLGTKFKIVSGYGNTAQIDLAMERGEVEGHAALGWVSAKTRNQKWLAEGKVKILAQYGFTKHPDLPNVPLFAQPQDDAARQAITVMFVRQEFGRPFLVPPGVPAERLAALRAAFAATMKDKGFLADARKADLEINPVAGEQLDALSARVSATRPEVAQRLRAILAGKSGK